MYNSNYFKIRISWNANFKQVPNFLLNNAEVSVSQTFLAQGISDKSKIYMHIGSLGLMSKIIYFHPRKLSCRSHPRPVRPFKSCYLCRTSQIKHLCTQGVQNTNTLNWWPLISCMFAPITMLFNAESNLGVTDLRATLLSYSSTRSQHCTIPASLPCHVAHNVVIGILPELIGRRVWVQLIYIRPDPHTGKYERFSLTSKSTFFFQKTQFVFCYSHHGGCKTGNPDGASDRKARSDRTAWRSTGCWYYQFPCDPRARSQSVTKDWSIV